MAIVMRMVRATMLEVLGQDYVRTARAKGVGRRTVISKHALRNALIPVVTIVGFEIGVLIGGAAIIETIFGLPGVGYDAPAGDLRPRLPRDPGDDAADRVHLHLRQPARRHPLRRPRPEDHAGMSPRRRAQPVFATEGAGEVAAGWEAMPQAAARLPRQVAQPDRARRRRHRRLQRPRRPASGRSVWRLDPDELVALRFEAPSWAHPMGTDELGRDTLARIIHGAQVSLQVGAISVSIAFVGGVAVRPAGRLLQGDPRHGADAARRHHVLAARDRARDHDRRPARPEPPQRDDRDRDRDPARVRAGRARRRARGDGLSVHRVVPRARGERPADHGAST